MRYLLTRCRCQTLVVALLLANLSTASFGQEMADADIDGSDSKPLWEVGVGVGSIYGPDYPAAGENSLNVTPFPYFVYRGRIIRAGDRGILQGRLINNERLQLSIGLDGAFRVDADDNEAREGMPDLDYLFEIGPRLSYKLLPGRSRQELNAELQLRTVFSTDLNSVSYEGVVLNPSLIYRRRRVFFGEGGIFASISPQFGFNGINDYFYQVEPRFARPGRPAYRADPGYIGTEFSLAAGYPITKNLRLGAGVRLGYFGLSSNKESPLHRDDFNIAVGVGLIWSIFQSDQQVASE